MKRRLNEREKEILNKISQRVGYIPEGGFEGDLLIEYFVRGTFTSCILTNVFNEIVGIGMTKKYKYDSENVNIATDVSFAKASHDYFNITKYGG